METTSRQVALSDFLAREPSTLSTDEALRLAQDMGGLAAWCLHPEVRQKAAACYRENCLDQWAAQIEAQPRCEQLPDESGACWILFVRKSSWPGLAPAFVLPLSWRRGEHSSRLPPPLRHLADEVLCAFKDNNLLPAEETKTPWGLHFAIWPEELIPDLSLLSWKMDPASGAVPLAGGLMAAIQGGHPARKVWATGKWSGSIAQVGDLDEKLQLAHRFGAEVLYVPESNVPEALAWVDRHNSRLKIEAIPSEEPHPQVALNAYWEHFNIPPARVADNADNFAARCRFYLRDPNEDRARNYYLTHLMPEVADRQVRQPLSRVWPDWKPRLLVAIISDGWEVIPLLMEALHPKRCLLLYTKEKEHLSEALRGYLENRPAPPLARAEYLSFPTLADLVDQMPARLRASLDQEASEQVLLDLTLGNKLMTLALDHEARAGHRLIYIQHELADRRRAIPSSVWPRLAQVSPDGQRSPLTIAPGKP